MTTGFSSGEAQAGSLARYTHRRATRLRREPDTACRVPRGT